VGEGDEADWHECDRVFDHNGDHNCHCAHAWPRPERPVIGSERTPMNAVEKLHSLERIASSADWQGRAATPHLFAMFCNELLQVIDIDAVDGITEPYEYPDDQNAIDHAEYTRQRFPWRSITDQSGDHQ
jgi:hypothetical protein